MSTIDEHPRPVPSTKYNVISDSRPMGVTSIALHPHVREGVHTLEPKAGSDLPQDTPMDVIRLLGPPALWVQTPSAPPLSSATIISGDKPTPFIDHTQVGINTHCSDIPNSDMGMRIDDWVYLVQLRILLLIRIDILVMIVDSRPTPRRSIPHRHKMQLLIASTVSGLRVLLGIFS